jgi:hypothetical protein
LSNRGKLKAAIFPVYIILYKCILRFIILTWSIRSNSQSLSLSVPLEGVQVEDSAGGHQAGDGGEEPGIAFVFQSVQHLLENEKLKKDLNNTHQSCIAFVFQSVQHLLENEKLN